MAQARYFSRPGAVEAVLNLFLLEAVAAEVEQQVLVGHLSLILQLEEAEETQQSQAKMLETL